MENLDSRYAKDYEAIMKAGPDQVEDIKMDNVDELIARLQWSLETNGQLSYDENEEAKEMVETLKELKESIASSKIDIALADLEKIINPTIQ